MKYRDNRSEEIFARLCSDTYYGGFIYQNPKYVEGTEKEAGDVILWVRDWLMIFEIVWRGTDAAADTRSFIKRIGEKRDQLLTDFRVYADGDFNIHMTNEAGEAALYDRDYYNEDTTRGVVLIDAPTIQGKLHFETLRLTLEAPHPIAIITRSDFEAILTEVDTPADLGFYLGDRFKFLKKVYQIDPRPFLRLGDQMEQELMGLYKLGENSFDVDRWHASTDKRFWHRYRIERCEDIARRDWENENSRLIDFLASEIRKSNRTAGFTLQHAWELALTTRRERAFLSEKILKKVDVLSESGRDQKFATYNSGTGCWDVFYFNHGLDGEYFRNEAQQMADRKLWVERIQNDFKESVFCFALRSSPLKEGVAEVVLTVSDAWKWVNISPAMLSEALKFFGGQTETRPIKEFPIR